MVITEKNFLCFPISICLLKKLGFDYCGILIATKISLLTVRNWKCGVSHSKQVRPGLTAMGKNITWKQLPEWVQSSTPV